MAKSTTPTLVAPATETVATGLFPTLHWTVTNPVDWCKVHITTWDGAEETAYTIFEVLGGGSQLTYWYKLPIPLTANKTSSTDCFRWTVTCKESANDESDPAVVRSLYTPTGLVTISSGSNTSEEILPDGRKRVKKSRVLSKRNENYNDIVEPIDATIPTVLTTDPLHEAVDVAIDSPITIDFSESMAPARMTITVTDDGTPVTGIAYTWNTSANEVVGAHTADFTNLTEYTVTVTGYDLAGNPMERPYVFTFTTVAGT